MEQIEPGPGWADAVSKILHEGKKAILSRAIKEKTDDQEEEIEPQTKKPKVDPIVKCSNVIENELKSIATAGIVQLFNVFKTVNKKADKKKKKKKKKKKHMKKRPMKKVKKRK